jgi:hypothetical protein
MRAARRRALTDAIRCPRGETAHVIAFDPAGAPHGAVPGADIGPYLARHGIKVTVSAVGAGRRRRQPAPHRAD